MFSKALIAKFIVHADFRTQALARTFPRARMSARAPLRTVIFDGDCAFCLRSIALGRRLDWWKCMEWRARLEPGVRERFPQLSQEETQGRMVSIRPDGRSYGGFFAVRDILLHLPLTLLPALLLYLPGMSWIGVPCYRWIASNRYRFGGAREGTCSVSLAPREPGEGGSQRPGET